MSSDDLLVRGRDAYARRAWGDACSRLSAADQQASLAAADLERLAMAAYLTGREDVACAVLDRRYRVLIDLGEVAQAVRCAFWLGMMLLQGGQPAQGGGWLARAQRELDAADVDGVERGYLVVAAALQSLGGGDARAALAEFQEAADLCDRFGDPDLFALSRLGLGQALIELDGVAEGMAMLDDAMIVATSAEVSAIVTGIVYCAVILACHQVFDLRRAQEWTMALQRWCEPQQDLRPYRGQCLVHRSEILQLRGHWQDAMSEVQAAWAHLAEVPGDPVIGMAHYQLAELHRLQGAFAASEDCYRQASQWGHPVQPGLAMLRLAQGKTDEAEAAIRRVEQQEQDRVGRARVLPAFVEITLAVDDVVAARAAVDELSRTAEDLASPLLSAVAASSRGRLLLAEEDAAACCGVLREATVAWRELDAPYEVALAQLLMARACLLLGDRDTATIELASARRAFERLGAVPALAQIKGLTAKVAPVAPGGLTAREVEVLGLVAKGRTNRQIGDGLGISDKTVARHVSNIFTKIGVSSRAAATGFAYEHDLA